MEMLFTINPHPHYPMNANTNIETFSSLPIPIQESESHQEEIDVVAITNDVLPPRVDNDDSDEEVDALRVDNSNSNSEHEYSVSEDSDFDNPPVLLPPPEPPDKEFDFEIDFRNEFSVVRNTIVKFECIDARIVFSDKNDVLSYFMFDKVIKKKLSSDKDKNSIGCLALYGALELQPDVQQVVDSMVKRLKSWIRKLDGKFVVVDLRLDMLDKRGCQDINNGYVGGSKKCYNPEEIAFFLKKLGFDKDTATYLTHP
uniref:GDP-fucose protein O-fucosyltransferase protein n=1 Tax=Tanacetum cinerariifolium TaxID=118510 RepID=A0A6L2KQY6_TANCI|nr:GDP-fucose protein O-fucosyltransferase protein [Tanacetum cinerariifolium]